MSAFDEFDLERQEIDSLVREGYSIVGIEEDLDGAKVRFTSPDPDKNDVELLLLTADARKHVTTVLVAGNRPQAPIESHI
ncbi:hypothetical protein C2I18_10770 [Paenibacillus sp. PK3_47]|uniref:hypothetical protein n=1 Tax=Paenibacillus sp. PK3_47 TaxID=2072642 RepID=UPI00201E2BD4|nr:hypothetical protein [Paenibacillus sp. PK3_47]UQZ33966.1 hypothetical protein C2I18_10770 [Paenibacillus sp. PK3_47]